MAKTVKASVRVGVTGLLYILLAVMVWHHLGLGALLLVWGQCLGSPAPRGTCHSTTSTPYRYYSTHSDYEDVRYHGADFTLPGCTARKFYMFSRHGIRYPTRGEFTPLQKRGPEIHRLVRNTLANGTLCKQEQEALKNWHFRFESEDADLLAPSGERESHDLGVRYAHRFPTLLGLPYSPERYQFQHTYKPRTFVTARGLANGMFNRSDFHMAANPASCDPLLRFYDCCDKFQKTVKHQPVKEQTAFGRGPEMKAVINNVSRRLGLQDSLSLTDVLVLYGLCAFEHSILSSSPWCAAFYTEDMKVLEYYQDLKYYWQYGYGHSINYEQSCNLVKDLIGYLKDNSSTVTGMIRVGHDSSLMPFCARLGLFRDSTPPLANNMAEQSNRKWRSSVIASFGANIVFVEYQCGSDSKVRVFHNEKPLALPMCPASGCPLSNILDSYLGSFVNSCDFQKTCEYDPHHVCDGHVTHSGTCVPSIIG